MNTHHLTLTSRPYHNVAAGRKTIESRLFDEKRQKIAVGDTIIFGEQGKPEHAVSAVVTALVRCSTFEELFADHDPSLFGETTRDFLLRQIRAFYSSEDEQKYGVVGIRFRLLDR